MSIGTQEKRFDISEEHIVEATKAALGPKAVVESSDVVLVEEPGVGFLGIHFLIAVRARESPGQRVVDVPMFAKMLPPDEGAPHFFKAFPTESSFFKKLQGPLNEVFRSPNGQEGPKWSPKCYFATGDLVIFENLGGQGYKTAADPNLSIEHFRMVCQALARFHSAGLLLAENRGREAAIEMCPELQDDVLFSNDFKYGGVHVRNASADSLAVLLPSILTPAEKSRLKELQEKLHALNRGMQDHLEKAKIGPVIPLHGDCHANNFMFKYDEEGNPTDAVLIDFQLARYNVPALDIAFCLHLSASPEFVESYGDEVYRCYYENLEKEVSRCGLHINKILTFEIFLESVRRIQPTVLYMACMYTTVMQAPKMELGKIMLDPFEYRRFLMGCRAAEILRWFHSEPSYRNKIETMLRKVLEL